ncbi:condensation domain-containing protein [Vibrio sp. PP-XX7]
MSADDVTAVAIPANLIPDECTGITPEMLPLTDLTPQEIDTITATVDGGVANVQDIYPRMPLQEGILFHHLLKPESDPYITPVIMAFNEQARLDDFLAALQAVIQRHDILRTAVVWNGLHEAQQVVWRHARLSVTELTVTELTTDELVSDEMQTIDVVQALQNRFAPTQMQMDIAQAPLLAAYQVEDREQGVGYCVCCSIIYVWITQH